MAARSEVRRLLEHAIDDLPEAFRLVFMTREIEELSIEGTAANLNIRPETVSREASPRAEADAKEPR